MKARTPPDLDDAQFTPLGEAELPALQRLLERCADFEILVTGAPPTSAAAVELMEACPAGHPIEKKLVFGVERDGDLIGALDLLRDYPKPNEWYLGLLLLAPDMRKGGTGAKIIEAVRAWVRAQGGRTIHLTVQSQNPDGERFWTKMGFQPVGKAIQVLENQTNEVLRMELVLDA